MAAFDLFRPDFAYDHVWNIDADALRGAGINALVVDVDNTVCRYNRYDMDERTIMWFFNWKAHGGRALLCSNNHPERVHPVAQLLSLPFLPDAHKPSRACYAKACEIMKSEPAHTAGVGDQLITDVHGAKRAGLRAILLNPLGGREFIGTYFNRVAESTIMLLSGIRRAKRG